MSVVTMSVLSGYLRVVSQGHKQIISLWKLWQVEREKKKGGRHVLRPPGIWSTANDTYMFGRIWGFRFKKKGRRQKNRTPTGIALFHRHFNYVIRSIFPAGKKFPFRVIHSTVKVYLQGTQV